MEIRKIQGIVISSLLVFGLAGCSNSSSSWRDADNSPWKTKRDSQEATEEFVELDLEEPIMVVEPERESMFETEPVLTEPWVPEPEPVEEAPSFISSDIMSAPASAYAVQAYAGRRLRNVNNYVSSHGLDYMQIVKTNRNGDVIYVLVSLHNNHMLAREASIDLEQRTGSKPWVRSVAGLQRIYAD